MTRSRLIAPENAEMVQAQIDMMKDFRLKVDAFVRTCEAWADEELAAAEGEDAKKNGKSQRRSRRKQKRS